MATKIITPGTDTYRATIFRGRNGELIPVPRHAEIGEGLARKIVRDARR